MLYKGARTYQHGGAGRRAQAPRGRPAPSRIGSSLRVVCMHERAQPTTRAPRQARGTLSVQPKPTHHTHPCCTKSGRSPQPLAGARRPREPNQSLSVREERKVGHTFLGEGPGKRHAFIQKLPARSGLLSMRHFQGPTKHTADPGTQGLSRKSTARLLGACSDMLHAVAPPPTSAHVPGAPLHMRWAVRGRSPGSAPASC